MAIIKIVNAEGGSDARYDVRRMTPEERRQFDSEGRPLGANNPDQWSWTPGLPGARGGTDNSHIGMPGGGGGGGSVIPGAGTYLFEQALAQAAYDRAIAALETQRRQRQSAAGVGADWAVDPKVMYGGYQQMLRNQGMELNAADDLAAERGLFGGGLGRQAETNARYGHSVEQLGFKNQLAGWEQEYQQGKARAEYEKQMAMMQALMSGYGNAYGDWGGYDEPGSDVQSAVNTGKRDSYLGGRGSRPVQRNPYTGGRRPQQALQAIVPGGRRPSSPRYVAGINRSGVRPRGGRR